MEVIILPSPEEVARTAARIVAGLVRRNPRAVLGLATGATQEPMYAELVRLYRQTALDFSQLTTFNLDEYVGCNPEHPGSFHAYMSDHFFRHVNIAPERIHIPDGMSANIPATCTEYERLIRVAGGIDLQLLGIGVSGHIGFNEPSSSLSSRTRLKTLTSLTRGNSTRRHAITMGIGTILEARRCLVLASGSSKAKAVASMIEGPLTAMAPASALQLHPRTTALIDEAAGAELALADYYREVHVGKPQFQRDEDGT
jgi:glucosamine-6-phosphate deaminase